MQGNEMNHMKKIIIIAVLLLVIALAAGCGNNRPKAPADDSKAGETVSISTPDPETSPVYESQKPSMPFKDLNMFEVDHITVEFGIHSYRLSDQECAKFVELLNKIVIYEKDNSWKGYDGLNESFETVFKKDGTSFDVKYCWPFVLIDGQGYETKQRGGYNIDDYIYDIYLYQFYQ